MKHDKEYLIEICKKFQIDIDLSDVRSYGSGHINDTYAVYDLKENPQYILQRINHLILTNPAELMNNIVRVTDHIRQKLRESNANDIDRKVMTVINTVDNTSYYMDNEGNYWRMYFFIKNARTYDSLESLKQSYEAAKAFGQFQQLLSDLPEPPLFETITDFHCGYSRLAQFKEALENDAANRAAGAKEEIDFLLNNTGIFDVFPKMAEEGKITIRTTHNDTKINNVMIDDNTHEGICVIDLDTVMPGLSLYDFGDIARTTISSAQEDEPDLSKVYVEPERFEAFTRGYLESAGKFLNNHEKDLLVHSGKMITLIIGTRFLTDHLSGDVYFKIYQEGHNLQRCKSQFKRVQSIVEHEDELNEIINKIETEL